MTGHEITVKKELSSMQLICQCGYKEVLEDVVTVKRIILLAEAHKAEILIKAMELLGVGKKKEE